MVDPFKDAEKPSRSQLFQGYPPLADYPVEPVSDELMSAPVILDESFDYSQQSGRETCTWCPFRRMVTLLTWVASCLPR